MKTVKARELFDEPVTEDGLAEAIKRGGKRQASGLNATAVHYMVDQQALMVGFADHSAIALPVANYPELAALCREELERLELGFGGSALCLEGRDLHISIAGLVSASRSLMELAATVIAARNGSRRSEAKALASRENGLKGGRPRKSVAES